MNLLHEHMRRLVGKDERHFCPTTPMADMRELHLYYPLATLQKEIEKRTFYLGKYRRPVDANGNPSTDAPHLLDLIGMSRDEADVLYPFAKSAMADVFEHLNRATPGYPKIFDWEDKKEQAETLGAITGSSASLQGLTTNTIAASGDSLAATISGLKDFAVLTGTVKITSSTAFGAADKALLQEFVPHAKLMASVTKKFKIKSSGDDVATTVTANIELGEKELVFAGFSTGTDADKEAYYQIVPYKIEVPLSSENELVTAEWIDSIASITVVSTDTTDAVPYLANPKELKAGSRFTFTGAGTVYETLVDTNENILRANATTTDANLPKYILTLATNDTYFEEGIHYYIGMPAFLNESLINPLDNAVLEALVNRILWKWLSLAYPGEAAAYDALYQQAVMSLRERCNVFNKNWVNRTPRIF